MKIARFRTFVSCLCLVALGGCSSDRESLDQFSRAYTTFREAVALVDQAARLPVEEDSEYWTAMAAAMNTRASNGDRAHSATMAIEAYRVGPMQFMAVFSETLDSMDSTVTALIEAANRIGDESARAKGAEVAAHARELQVAYASLVPIYERRFALQLKVLRDMVREGGALSAIVINRHGAEEAGALREELGLKWKEAASQWQDTKDAFSAMKGQFDLKSYPSRWD